MKTKISTKVGKKYNHHEYPSVNGLIMSETPTHLLIDATYDGKEMVESNLKFIIRKSDGYWTEIGWNHPINDSDNYKEGYDIIKLFQEKYSQPAVYYFFAFYGRIKWEAAMLQKDENPKIKEILEKKFSSKKEMAEFLFDYIHEKFTFKDIGINNTHGGGIVCRHSCKELYDILTHQSCE